MISVELNNRQSTLTLAPACLRAAVEQVLVAEGVVSADISLAVVDDAAIQDLNRRYLGHDDATDVLSFLLEPGARIEGEVIVSAETAIRSSRQYDCSAHEELLRYIIHGTLHLLGYDDRCKSDRRAMHERQEWHLQRCWGTRAADTAEGSQVSSEGVSPS